ncbi:hypothetical protein cyc_08178 [Cyclospora cayetanensis]|uniref:Uncharacterized protein n=1 Tax=Cyclospora cayetanensis TaxID=88456 RepID=A0A1D3D2E6_9EIME|nr:hypothetical protein cyc_08178 [Cyclospora cayetanensis]
MLSSPVLRTLCADGVHLLMPVCVGDYQEVGCASQERFGCGDGYAANVLQVMLGRIGSLDMWFAVLWRPAGVRAFRQLWQEDGFAQAMWTEKWLCADGAHLLMPVCVGAVQLVGCAGQDDAELAGCVDASGSTISVPLSVWVSSCGIACVESNNINSSNRTAYVSMGLCADGAHLLMLVCVGDVQKVGCARQVRFGCGGG